MDTLARAEAAIIAAADAHNARNRRIGSDWMVRKLDAICKANRSSVTFDGKPGFDQMIAYAMSSRAMRRQRATVLLQARRAKLFNGCKTVAALKTAALYRKDERCDGIVAPADEILRRQRRSTKLTSAA